MCVCTYIQLFGNATYTSYDMGKYVCLYIHVSIHTYIYVYIYKHIMSEEHCCRKQSKL